MIVIIGAGLAGLAAALKLKDAGYTEFIIIEAQDHVGGRVRGDPYPYLIASSLYYGSHNPIHNWIRTTFGKSSYDYIVDNSAKELLMPNGLHAPGNLVQQVLKSSRQAKRIFQTFSSSIVAKKSAVNHFRESLDRIVETCSKNSTEEDKKVIEAIGDWIERKECFDNFCGKFDDLSTSAYVEQSGHIKSYVQNLDWCEVANEMAHKVGRDKIYFGWPVNHVEYSTSSARVVLDHGMVIDCDHVLVTIPAGALLQTPWRKSPSGFIEPMIEPERRAMMERVGFGSATQISLRPEGSTYSYGHFGLLWTCSPADVGLPNWTKDLIEFYTDNPYNLIARIGRIGATEVEKCSDTEIGEILCKVLKLFKPEVKVPVLKEVRMIRWSTNPYFCGTNSYPSVRGDEHDVSSAWEPIYVCNDATGGDKTIPRILFAGEATAGEHCGTAHGAIVSGWREADRLLKILKP